MFHDDLINELLKKVAIRVGQQYRWYQGIDIRILCSHFHFKHLHYIVVGQIKNTL